MRLHLIARTGTVIIGCLGIVWGALAFPTFRRSVAIEDVAARIIQEQPFKIEPLLALEPQLAAIEAEPACHALSSRNVAVIRFRIAELSLSVPDGAQIDQSLAALRSAIVRSLNCSPTDAFLWLGLFWAESVSGGFRSEYFDYLRMSYRLGPNEGWIIEKRNYIVLAMYQFLPPDLAALAVDEFVKLLQPQFVVTATRIFTGPGWAMRDILLPRLAKTPLSERQLFYNLLQSQGVDVEVPGIAHKQRLF